MRATTTIPPCPPLPEYMATFKTILHKSIVIVPAPRWETKDEIDSYANTYQPYFHVPDGIICNMQNPWRISLPNLSTNSWSYRDPNSYDPPSPSPPAPASYDYRQFATKIVEKPQWYKHFHTGVRCTQPDTYASRVKRLVHAGSWDTTAEINELVYAFVGRASMYFVDDNCTLGIFASEVLHQFKCQFPDIYDQVLERFSRILVGTFIACWDQACPWSIARKSDMVEINSYVPASVNLSKFLGECIGCGIVDVAEARACLRVLISQMTSIEHLEAIYHIISRAGEFLWVSVENPTRDILEFLGLLKANVGAIVHPAQTRTGGVAKVDANARFIMISQTLQVNLVEANRF
ncbi:hypothetical protein FA15DRAFT_418612 [Coprinopsis marcescibilis]|uniref:Uncharacterized protein n=1 Tax=Coprinopsis marcescibilis TaxID=230819 RepID=A0A5C3KVF9_COPMA|nr:hypothetical protein FA15DRAFT_418612 [Coprinopsis marcescibilis]